MLEDAMHDTKDVKLKEMISEIIKLLKEIK